MNIEEFALRTEGLSDSDLLGMIGEVLYNQSGTLGGTAPSLHEFQEMAEQYFTEVAPLLCKSISENKLAKALFGPGPATDFYLGLTQMLVERQDPAVKIAALALFTARYGLLGFCKKYGDPKKEGAE